MKNRHTGAIVVLVAIGLSLSLLAIETRAVDPAVAPPKHESIDAEVLKVFSAKDGEAVFRAYLIKWKDQEVIATDQLARTNYNVKDKIRVLVTNLPFPKGMDGPNLLHFHAMPERFGLLQRFGLLPRPR